MNSVAVLQPRSPTKGKSGVAAVAAELEKVTQIHASVVSMCCLHNEFGRETGSAEAIAGAREYASSTSFAEDHATLMRAAESATSDFIGTELKFLMASWPNVSKADLAGFGMVLSVEVKMRQPSRYGLAQACHTLRTTMRFVPTIAEVFEAIDVAEQRLQRTIAFHRGLPKRLRVAAKNLK